MSLVPGTAPGETPEAPREHSLQFRRSCAAPNDWAAYRVHAPMPRTGHRDVSGRRTLVHREYLRGSQAGGDLDKYEAHSTSVMCQYQPVVLWASSLLTATLSAAPPIKKVRGQGAA